MFGVGPTELILLALLGLGCLGVALAGVIALVVGLRRGNQQPRLVGCPQCGRNVLPEAATCPNCGQALGG